MPQRFSPEEVERIREQLLEAGKELFRRYGIKKTSIDRIVQEVGIAKGSFYRFFKTKEDLYLTLFARIEARMRQGLEEEVRQRSFPSIYDEVIFTLELQFDAVLREPLFMWLLDPEETSYLFRKIGPERLAEHQAIDDRYLEGLLESWRNRGMPLVVEQNLAVEAIKSLFYLFLHRREIGAAFSDVFRFQIRNLVNGMSRGDYDQS